MTKLQKLGTASYLAVILFSMGSIGFYYHIGNVKQMYVATGFTLVYILLFIMDIKSAKDDNTKHIKE